MRRQTSTLLATAVAGLVALPGALEAQESTTRGFMLGAHLSGASLTIENEDRNDAGGGGLIVRHLANSVAQGRAQAAAAQPKAEPPAEGKESSEKPPADGNPVEKAVG